MKDIVFANPEYFYLLVIIPFLIVWYIFRIKRQKASLQVSTIEGFVSVKPSIRQRLRLLPTILRLAAIVFIIIALARPQSHSSHKDVKTEGIDIVIALDISSSMEARDFRPSRIEAAKKTAIDFVEGRKTDRIGLVIFAAESFTQCPITVDHDVLINLFKDIHINMVTDGTAIGLGLATAVDRLKDSKAISKVIILITDGVNNTGFIAPLTAAEIAKTFGIRTYTIGVGTKGMAPYPFKTPFGIQYQDIEVKIDEELLTKIAETTNGKYFRATNNDALVKIYEEIDKMEKTKIDELIFNRYSEEFLPFALIALVLIGFEILLRFTLFKSLP